jgi:hypothetical protein
LVRRELSAFNLGKSAPFLDTDVCSESLYTRTITLVQPYIHISLHFCLTRTGILFVRVVDSSPRTFCLCVVVDVSPRYTFWSTEKARCTWHLSGRTSTHTQSWASDGPFSSLGRVPEALIHIAHHILPDPTPVFCLLFSLVHPRTASGWTCRAALPLARPSTEESRIFSSVNLFCPVVDLGPAHLGIRRPPSTLRTSSALVSIGQLAPHSG